MPWPNRLADGKYQFDGADYQVDLTEPAAHNAIHGLLRWRNWVVREQAADRVVVGTALHPMTGYPFQLDVRLAYSLGPDGLRVSTTATNLGELPCPFGTGQHPYLSPGQGLVDDATLELEAETWIPTDERSLPAGRAAVAGTELDFHTPRRIGSTTLDHAFTDLKRDTEGLAWVRLTAPDGRTTRMWADRHYGFIQLYSGDTQRPDRARRGLAVEPMTCPANSFQSGDSLIRLEPGQSFTATWGIQV